MLEHTLTSHTLYFLYLAHSLATVTRQALSFQLLAHPFCLHRTKSSSLLSIVSGLFSVACAPFLSPQDEEKLFIINRLRTIFRRTEAYLLFPAKNCLRNG